ncbi:uncharacterized protein NEMAJ01_0208 [Nematocida major]|uniref:uncharacterized protein n=1 Tax=Nematocida major TaxID=1912982 RepID=UPI0020081962|nr:uncharacterized protein NEMAJ01_0208 [Nematocida major]KAH9385312.1 hypothetical protein NEMAJ01_0208 [Nematocida major]
MDMTQENQSKFSKFLSFTRQCVIRSKKFTLKTCRKITQSVQALKRKTKKIATRLILKCLRKSQKRRLLRHVPSIPGKAIQELAADSSSWLYLQEEMEMHYQNLKNKKALEFEGEPMAGKLLYKKLCARLEAGIARDKIREKISHAEMCMEAGEIPECEMPNEELSAKSELPEVVPTEEVVPEVVPTEEVPEEVMPAEEVSEVVPEVAPEEIVPAEVALTEEATEEIVPAEEVSEVATEVALTEEVSEVALTEEVSEVPAEEVATEELPTEEAPAQKEISENPANPDLPDAEIVPDALPNAEIAPEIALQIFKTPSTHAPSDPESKPVQEPTHISIKQETPSVTVTLEELNRRQREQSTYKETGPVRVSKSLERSVNKQLKKKSKKSEASKK